MLDLKPSDMFRAIIIHKRHNDVEIIIDKFDNGHYDYLVNYKACRLINSEESLQSFLEGKKLEISDEALAYCGLKDENINFNLGEHLIKCYEEFHAN